MSVGAAIATLILVVLIVVTAAWAAVRAADAPDPYPHIYAVDEYFGSRGAIARELGVTPEALRQSLDGQTCPLCGCLNLRDPAVVQRP